MRFGGLAKLALPLAATALTGGGAGALQLLGGSDPSPAIDIAAALRSAPAADAAPPAQGTLPCTITVP